MEEYTQMYTTENLNQSSDTSKNWTYATELIVYFDLETLQLFHGVVGICAIIISLTGLIGNSLSLMVLLRKDMKSTTYTFLTALAISDILVLISGTLLICLVTIEEWGTETLIDDTILPHIYRFMHPTALTCILTSIWITVALTADRYIAVCHGMRRKHLCTVPRAWKVIVAIFILSFLYNIPTFFEYEIEYRHYPENNKTIATYQITELGKSDAFRQIYRSWLFLPVMWVIPFLSLLYMNICLIIAVRKTKTLAKRLGQPPLSKGTDITIMLIVVIILFLLCQSPHMIATTLWVFKPLSVRTVFYTKFSFASTLLVILNSSVNFFIYTLFGQKFRRRFVQMFCCCCRKRWASFLGQSESESPMLNSKTYTTRTQSMNKTLRKNNIPMTSMKSNQASPHCKSNGKTPEFLDFDKSVVPLYDVNNMKENCTSSDLKSSVITTQIQNGVNV